MENFKKYADAVDDWYVYDNSTWDFLLIAKSLEKNIEIFNFELYQKMVQ